ncbi:MAG: nucleotide exchange factor GrpE [Chitinophagales bacterium]|nr:nucleotide exchange factor GrpE [Chitinophagales bacterium]
MGQDYTDKNEQTDSLDDQLQNTAEAEANAGGEQDNVVSQLQTQVAELTAKNEELKDKYLRLFADFDNYKKRAAREKLDLIAEAGKEVILNLLPVLDDFERAMKAAEATEDVQAVKEGMQLIYNKLQKNLEQKGLKAMVSKGADFDTNFHEAITEIPAATDADKGKVVDEVERGYYLNDKIIRYAKVVVGK